MPHVRIETSVPRHPKFLRAGPVASWLWLCGLAYCQDGLTDGFIAREALAGVAPGLSTRAGRAAAKRLVGVGLWDEQPDGWFVVDFYYSPQPATTRDVGVRRRWLERLLGLWGRRCAYCGSVTGKMEVEHIIPVSRGGPAESLANLTIACVPCNRRKGTKTADEFGFPDVTESARLLADLPTDGGAH